MWNSLHHLAMLQPHRGSITFYDLRDVLDDLIGIEKGVENETLCIEEHKEPLGLDMEGYVDLVQVRFHDGEPHDFRGTVEVQVVMGDTAREIWVPLNEEEKDKLEEYILKYFGPLIVSVLESSIQGKRLERFHDPARAEEKFL